MAGKRAEEFVQNLAAEKGVDGLQKWMDQQVRALTNPCTQSVSQSVLHNPCHGAYSHAFKYRWVEHAGLQRALRAPRGGCADDAIHVSRLSVAVYAPRAGARCVCDDGG